MSTYVIGDVHGCFDELKELFKIIDAQDKDAHYIFVGDLLDRGPKQIEMARWAIENIKPEGKYRSVCGNHDEGLAYWFRNEKSFCTYHYGTDAIFSQAGEWDLLKKYVEFTDTLPLYIRENVNGKEFVITHGFVPIDFVDIDPYEQNGMVRDKFIWDRSAMYNPNRIFDNITIICGHTPVVLEEWLYFHPNDEICTVSVGDGIVNVDMGCFHTKRLAAYRLEDGVCFYNRKLKKTKNNNKT